MSGLIQGFAGYQQGKADAAIGKYNARLAEEQAVVERQQAGAAEEAQRRAARKLLGRQAAAIAESGTGGFSGSNLDIARQSAVEAELDALNIRYEGELKARGAKAEAEQFRAQAKNAKKQGRLALAAGLLQTAETYGGMAAGGGGGGAGGGG